MVAGVGEHVEYHVPLNIPILIYLTQLCKLQLYLPRYFAIPPGMSKWRLDGIQEYAITQFTIHNMGVVQKHQTRRNVETSSYGHAR